MARYRVLNLGGINTKVQPLLTKDGELTRCLNLATDQIGAKRKRPGYVAFRDTADGSAVNSLFSWEKEDGTTRYIYRASGAGLYYSDLNGTANWAVCGNGTITAGNHVGQAVLGDTMVVGDGAGSTRHSTNGTSFTDTTLAPVGEHLAVSSDRRVFICGTDSQLYWSVTNDATNWNTTGTSDSSSLRIPGAGKLNGVFNAASLITMTKASGLMHKWDGYSLDTVPTNLAYTSPYSVKQLEGYHIGLNRQGFFGYGGDRPEILSNPIEHQIYNDSGSAVAGTSFNSAPGGVYRKNYYCAVGTTTDDTTEQTVNNCVEVYNFQLDEWYNYQFANFPTAFHTYKDSNGVEQFVFGDGSGQVYTLSGTATSDNGAAIECALEGFLHLGIPDQNKRWQKLWAFANPGCKAQIQVAASDTFQKDTLNWIDIGDLSSGVTECAIGQSGRFLFYRLHESSTDARFQFFGFAADVSAVGR